MQIRHATLDDLPAVAEVIVGSLADDSSLRGLFPAGFRKDPAYEQHAHEILKNYLSPENLDRLVLVLEVPKQTARGPATSIASVAIWDMSHSRCDSTWRRPSQGSTNSDVDDLMSALYPNASDSMIDKLTALSNAVSYSQRERFANLEPYVYLEILATHPAHRGNGYAKALCAVGVEAARKQDLSVAVLTSSRGYIFFSGLAFADLGCVSLHAGGAQRGEDCVLKVMVLHPPPAKTRRRSSVFESLMAYVSPTGSFK